ncbi:MAG: hypothetical protein ACXW5U_12330 [Thermoanaerobaculia bacterium]
MNELTSKIQDVEREIARDKGPLTLFAFFERDDVYDRWDVVIAAPWAKFDEKTLRYVADVLKRHLMPGEMVRLARIVVLEPDEDPVKSLTEAYQVEHGQIELNRPQDFGLPVKYGYIITSRPAA